MNKLLTVEEELFCTRYERDILSGIVHQQKLERWVPGYCSDHTHKEHIARYDWAAGFVLNKSVLDIACGTGFGSYTLAAAGAEHVLGCDLDDETIQYAALRHAHPRLVFQQEDAEKFIPSEKFDVITSFETIEHLHQPEEFLKNIRQAMDAGSDLFISTPISERSINLKPDNIFHVREWGFNSFQEMLAKEFAIQQVYLQVYQAARPVNRMISGITKKLGIDGSDTKKMDRLVPFQYDPQINRLTELGKTWTGYQLVHCKLP